MQRIPDLDPDHLTLTQKQVYDDIVSGPRGVVQGPLRIWLNSPELARCSQELGKFCRYDSSLAQRLSELAIITIGAHWQAGFEWHIHAPIAQAVGIDADAIAAIKVQAEPVLHREDEQIVYGFTHCLVTKRVVDQDLFDTAMKVLGKLAVVDLVGVIGYYNYIAMTIVAFGVETPGGDPFTLTAG